MHVVARVVRGVHALSGHRARTAIERAIACSLARSDFRIVRLALRRSSLELVVEADDKRALARGMQGFQVAAARQLNRALARRGTMFPDRYRPRILRTRAAVRAALSALTARTDDAPPLWLAAPAAAFTALLAFTLARARPPP